MKIGVVLSSYNRELVIQRAIDQIARNINILEPEDFQISIYDDGSELPVNRIVKDIDKLPYVVFQRVEENGGSIGLAKSTAVKNLTIDWDFLWIQDDENIVADDYLKRSIEIYQELYEVTSASDKWPTVGSICGQHNVRPGNRPGRITPQGKPVKWDSYFNGYQKNYGAGPLPDKAFLWFCAVGGVIVSRKVWDMVGDQNTKFIYQEDTEWKIRSRFLGYHHYRTVMSIGDYNPDSDLIHGRRQKRGGFHARRGKTHAKLQDFSRMALYYPYDEIAEEFREVRVARDDYLMKGTLLDDPVDNLRFFEDEKDKIVELGYDKFIVAHAGHRVAKNDQEDKYDTRDKLLLELFS